MSRELNQRAHLTGSCLCGGVRYRIDGMLRGVINCFCTQCQKTSGHHVAATRVNRDDLTLETDSSLKWFESSPGIQRGFCGECGGNLFWNDGKNNQISVMAGTLDKPTSMKTIENIFVRDASDYFDIPKLSRD